MAVSIAVGLAARAAEMFDVPGKLQGVEPFGEGNVNDTFLAAYGDNGTEERVILQRINRNVFPHPEWIMRNLRLMTDHVRHGVQSTPPANGRSWLFQQVVNTRKGHDFFVDEDNNCWRALTYIDHAVAHEEVQSLEHAEEVGFVLGYFQRLLADLPVHLLLDTLPGSHITPTYLEKLDIARSAPLGRGRLRRNGRALECDEFVRCRRSFCTVLENAKASGTLSLRPIHGDPKTANVLVDSESGRGIAIIDMDTVKPGLLHYDVGDCLRSCCNPAGEGARDLDAVCFDLDLCRAVMRGYMPEAREFLTDCDREHLFDCIRILPLELGVRFFADYLAGDVYFKTRYADHNLDRACVQFRLTQRIEENESEIRAILDEC
jgi:Ser/Thr protein kinase RdoA (MazF antagonist)